MRKTRIGVKAICDKKFEKNIQNFVKSDETNSYYLGLVQNLLAGTNGCIVSFLQFFYQCQVCSGHQEIQECFQNLYQKELENCQILSQILIDMGGDPQFFSSSKKFISTRAVSYVKDENKMFLSDIEFLEVNVLDIKSAISKIEKVILKESLKKVLENKKNELKTLKKEFFKTKII